MTTEQQVAPVPVYLSAPESRRSSPTAKHSPHARGRDGHMRSPENPVEKAAVLEIRFLCSHSRPSRLAWQVSSRVTQALALTKGPAPSPWQELCPLVPGVLG